MSNQVKSITKKSEDISGWYNDVIAQARLAEHGPVKGTMIIRPYGYALWEAISKGLDIKIKGLGAQNAYFPLFIPYSFLEKEKTHVKGFSPELAVVTHAGGEELKEPVVVRPTSETIMYEAYSRWVQSFRDLPLIINQWNNVVRWEKRPYMFLRTTEFLWQEGHSAHVNFEEAQKMTEDALNMYVEFYQKTLGIFGYPGKKSETEKFAGADQTLTYEILAPDGKVIQGCTSHNLGQNFSKAFNVKYQSKEGKEEYVHQTSWGYTARSIGALIMSHGDDNGLVLPPQIAPVQVVIIPIFSKDSDLPNNLARKVFELLESVNLRVKIDDRDQSPGWKFNQAELEGIPLRIEIGNREAQNNEVSIKLRHDKNRFVTSKLENVVEDTQKLLDEMQAVLFEKSKIFTKENTRDVKTYDEFKEIMKTTRGFIRAFWCESPECEAKIKEETKANSRCLPLGSIEDKGECVYCGKEAKHIWLFGQSY